MVECEITKVFVKGFLKGQTITEIMPFITERRAKAWQAQVNRSPHTDYKVTEMNIIKRGDLDD